MLLKAALDNQLKKLIDANLDVTYWDGDIRHYGKTKRSKLHLTIKDPKIVRRMAKNISLAVGEAYMDGSLVVEGPLEELIALAYRNESVFSLKLHNLKYRHRSKNIKRHQKRQIAHHYDLGNDFYTLWLDSSLTYTCAYFKNPQDTLKQAQVNKRLHVLKKLQLKKNMTLLDIGCGWGGLLIEAAQQYGVRGFGVTLSKEQFDLANKKIKALKLTKLVEVKLMNYQDLPKLKRQFDRVVSVGFFEAVGQDNLATYFKVLQKVLKPEGISVLHTITSESEIPPDAWIDKYIFPGGYIPSIRETTALLPDFGFCMKDFESLGDHYAKTIYLWRKDFEKHHKEVIDMFDERLYRMWSFWLAASIAGFKSGKINLSQWVFTNGVASDWPLTREHLYK